MYTVMLFGIGQMLLTDLSSKSGFPFKKSSIAFATSCPSITFMVKCVTFMVSQVITLNISHLLHLCFFYT